MEGWHACSIRSSRKKKTILPMKSSSVKIAIKKTALVAIVTLSGMMVALLTIKKFSSLNQDVLLDDHHAVLLATLGDSALQHMDVPVASILLYNDTVIGAGYNTVVALGEAGGHAEINAISSALRSMGRERFDSLDRNNLMLVTTFEPCLMCRGAIVEYRIRNVVFLKQKRSCLNESAIDFRFL